MHRVVALVPPGIAPFELGIVVEVFGLPRPELDTPWWYELTVCTETPGPVRATAGGFSFHIEHGLEALQSADTVIVPGWNSEVSAAVIEAVRAAHERGARILAQAGVAPPDRWVVMRGMEKLMFGMAWANADDAVHGRSHVPTGVERERYPYLVEAIEDPTRRFALGVQWHPEASGGEEIAALVEAARS